MLQLQRSRRNLPKIVRSVVRRKFHRRVLLACAEFKDLAQHPWRHRGNRIDPKHRLAWRADDFVGHADQTLIAAAAEQQAKNRNLAEHVVEAIHRNEGTTHAHLIAGIIDAALDGRSDCRALYDALADRELAVLPRKFRAQPREGNAVLRSD